MLKKGSYSLTYSIQPTQLEWNSYRFKLHINPYANDESALGHTVHLLCLLVL